MSRRATSCRDYFDNLSERFISDKAKGVDATYLFQLEGDGGGAWTVTVKDNTISVSEGAIPNPNVTFNMKASDYLDMANGDLGGMKAFMTRKLKVSGNIPLAQKMNDFLPPHKDK
jgi:putative sterol carrier protein